MKLHRYQERGGPLASLASTVAVDTAPVAGGKFPRRHRRYHIIIIISIIIIIIVCILEICQNYSSHQPLTVAPFWPKAPNEARPKIKSYT